MEGGIKPERLTLDSAHCGRGEPNDWPSDVEVPQRVVDMNEEQRNAIRKRWNASKDHRETDSELYA